MRRKPRRNPPPVRDPNTGLFVSMKVCPGPGELPPRDPHTGGFLPRGICRANPARPYRRNNPSEYYGGYQVVEAAFEYRKDGAKVVEYRDVLLTRDPIEAYAAAVKASSLLNELFVLIRPEHVGDGYYMAMFVHGRMVGSTAEFPVISP